MSNIIVGYYFDIKKNIRRVWSISGHCVDTTAGYFFGNCPKYASGIDFTTQNVARYWCNTKKK